jgi:hypothetical protein
MGKRKNEKKTKRLGQSEWVSRPYQLGSSLPEMTTTPCTQFQPNLSPFLPPLFIVLIFFKKI